MGVLLFPQAWRQRRNRGGYVIDGSIQLKAASSQRYDITLTTSADWALSVLVQFARTGTTEPILGTALYRNSSNQLVCGSLTTTAVFRDVTAFYAIEVYGDHLYVNGVDLGACSTAALTNPSIGYDGSNYFDGYIADFVFRNGSTASLNGGEIDANGYWVPKRPSGATHTIADWSAVNSPVPTNNSPTNDPANDVGLYPVLSAITPVSATFSSAGTKLANSSSVPRFAPVTLGIPDGSWVFEYTLEDANSKYALIGIVKGNVAHDYNTLLGYGGANAEYAFYLANGKKVDNSNQTVWGDACTTIGKTVQIAVKRSGTSLKIWAGHNESGSFVWQASGDPVTEANPMYSLTISADDVWYFSGGPDGNVTAATGPFNFGQVDFTFTPPTGYKALCLAHFDEPDCADPDTEYAHNTFAMGASNTKVYITSFSPSAGCGVRVKRTDNTGPWYYADTKNGAGKYFYIDGSTPHAIQTGFVVASFDADGVTFGTVLTNGATYEYEVFKIGTEFDVQVETMAASGLSTFTHDMGNTPAFMFGFDHAGSDNHRVYHSSLGIGYYAHLNLANAFSNAAGNIWGSAPTTTNFYAAEACFTANATVTFWLFRHGGAHRFWPTVGNASADGPVGYIGGYGKSIWGKNASAGSTSWQMHSDALDAENVRSNSLLLDTNGVTTTSGNEIDKLAIGAKNRATNANLNGSTNTIVWGAHGVRALRGPGTAQVRAV